MRGVPQSGLWSEEAIASSGTGSERAEVASVALGNPPASQGPRGLHMDTLPYWGKVPLGRLRRKARFGDEGGRLLAPLGIAGGDDPGHPLLPRLHPER